MNQLAFYELIIPGYSTLTSSTLKAFKKSAANNKILDLIKLTQKAMDELQTSATLWNMVFGTAEAQKAKLLMTFHQNKDELLKDIANDPAYRIIKAEIARSLLSENIPEFQHLSKEQQHTLCATEFAQNLSTDFFDLQRFILKAQDEFNNLSTGAKASHPGIHLQNKIEEYRQQQKQLISDWSQQLMKDADYQNTIILSQIKQLAQFYPELNYHKNPATPDEPVAASLQLDLELFLFNQLQQINKYEIQFINLDKFNVLQAKHMAKAILMAFNQKAPLPLNEFIATYELDLLAYLQEQFKLINGGPKKKTEDKDPQEFLSALSFLWKNPAVDKANAFLTKLADAHGFIQATSFSTQNESSFLAMLDFYNYARFHEKIAETKTILSSLLTPLTPLYNEYRDIGLYEKNTFWKFLRILIPILITVAVIVALSFLLTPLMLPELTLIAVFIPALFIGLGASSLYVMTKDEIYKSLRNLVYGGPFEIPEFQVNERMIKAFQSQETAERVRTFYIEALEKCDNIESNYALIAQSLTEEQKKCRKENNEQRCQFALEWYDIHSNGELGIDTLPKIASKSLEKQSETDYEELLDLLKSEEKDMKSSIHRVGTDLKNNLTCKPNQPPTPANYTPGLFKTPRCEAKRKKVEDLCNLSQQLTTPSAA